MIYFLERPGEKSRLRYLMLLLLLIQYNVMGGLFPDERIPIGIPLQNILAYGSAIIMSMYLFFYLYKEMELQNIRWYVFQGMIYFVLLPFIAAFIIPYLLTGNLDLSRRMLVVIPFFYCILVLFKTTRAVSARYKVVKQQGGSVLYLERIIAAYIAFTFWLSLPIITYVDGGQVWEVCMTNTGFLIMTITYIRSSVLNAKADHYRLIRSEQKLQKLNTELQQKVEERTKKLEEANEQRVHTFINLVHETKTPLTLINNYLDEYISRNGLDEELALIKFNIEKLTHDVTNLFDLQRLEKGIHLYDHRQTTNFSRLLTNTLELFQSTARHKDIFILQQLTADIRLQASPDALSRIINNLLENAIRYTRRGGEIVVWLNYIPFS